MATDAVMLSGFARAMRINREAVIAAIRGGDYDAILAAKVGDRRILRQPQRLVKACLTQDRAGGFLDDLNRLFCLALLSLTCSHYTIY
jgi:hypothetical protein